MNAVSTLVPATVRTSIQEFAPGDTVRVNVTIKEGERTRVQAFQGIVIKGSYSKSHPPEAGATFIVRRVSYGTGVERTFLLCSPLLDSLENMRRGKVAQGRLYYLRGLSGRRARIREKRIVPGSGGVDAQPVAEVLEAEAPDAGVPEATPVTAAGQPEATSASAAQAADEAPAAEVAEEARAVDASGEAAEVTAPEATAAEVQAAEPEPEAPAKPEEKAS